jgi:type I restriction enzyme M protein
MIRTTSAFVTPPSAFPLFRANKYDLSISRYKQIEHKEVEYEKPNIVMEKVLVLEKDIAMDIQEIKSMIQ